MVYGRPVGGSQVGRPRPVGKVATVPQFRPPGEMALQRGGHGYPLQGGVYSHSPKHTDRVEGDPPRRATRWLAAPQRGD